MNTERISVFFIFLVTARLVAVQSSAQQDVQFTVDNACPGRVVSAAHCQEVDSLSVVQCAIQCSWRSGCVAFIRDSNRDLCRLCKAVPMADCANTESSSETAFRMKVTQGSCQNGGTFNSEERCDCTAGFAGDWCQRPLLDCKEGMALGYPQGLYNIQPTLAPQPFQVYCWMVFGRTYINRRFYTSLSFYRTWQEYRDGFGDPAGDHWIGLENLYHLTNSGIQYQLMVQLELENGTFYQQYYFFNIGDEADLYRLYIHGSWGRHQRPAGNSLAPSQGAPFSTYDADNDGDVMENCAERHQSGWWFPEGDCSLTKCNPHGVLVQSPAALWSGKPEDVFWLEDLGDLAIWKLKMWLHR